ncbi:hypothetical protein ABIA39_005307 [Nocardia sp. GAS34]
MSLAAQAADRYKNVSTVARAGPPTAQARALSAQPKVCPAVNPPSTTNSEPVQ